MLVPRAICHRPAGCSVTLAPEPLNLGTKPLSTGSLPVANTIGIVEVASRAVRAGRGPPVVTIAATLRRIDESYGTRSVEFYFLAGAVPTNA